MNLRNRWYFRALRDWRWWLAVAVLAILVLVTT